MKKLIIFDFDKTLADINSLHIQAWQETLDATGITEPLHTLLPRQSYLMERFDSYRRVKTNFFINSQISSILYAQFNSEDQGYIANQLLMMKESYLIRALQALPLRSLSKRLTLNLTIALDILASTNYIGVVSNTRESVIRQFLNRVGIEDCFTFVIGEESLWHDNRLQDKPDPFAMQVIPKKLIDSHYDTWYIGDDVRMDAAFAYRAQINYILFNSSDNALELIKLLERSI